MTKLPQKRENKKKRDLMMDKEGTVLDKKESEKEGIGGKGGGLKELRMSLTYKLLFPQCLVFFLSI